MRSSVFERLEAALSAHAAAGCFDVTIPWAYVEAIADYRDATRQSRPAT
jgi:hypothetical protein